MLNKFSVTGFKNFKSKTTLDLGNVKGFEFNPHLVKDNTILGSVIFGKNASGKTNICYAIMDIVNHLTDKTKTSPSVMPYMNLNADIKCVDFSYEFLFNGSVLKYDYGKLNPEELKYERLFINNKLVMEYDYDKFSGFSSLKGTENLKTKLETNKLSFIKYVSNNTVLENTIDNNVFKKFIVFVDNMLLFSSLLGGNKYYGYTTISESLTESIVKKGKLNDFENFLKSLGIDYNLDYRDINGTIEIIVKFPEGEVNFWQVASTGTQSVTLYYYWLISAEEASLVLMDEFDAYYHFELAEKIVKESLNRRTAQVIFTSHNTNLMNNDLFRPDCLFIIKENEVKSFADLTKKELRFAHNLQKMYKAGAFENE